MNAIKLNISFNDALFNQENWKRGGSIRWSLVLEQMKREYPLTEPYLVEEHFNSFKSVTEEIIGLGIYNNIKYEDYVVMFGI